ncbi:hypothetical protein [Bacillus sp. FJAT-49736]|uniref:hypothetical protein n=1 Tax=Bacillus sp. FJAT-49736 TaxID=2833582 RepID=UPI001BC98DE4|nr:hypothetical protein [Bacillus sp. FJAT-49736]MBS4173285.1 hypothetical protein [Bacillus sp. FJAT-49736]
MKKIILSFILIISISLLSGCLYPQDKLAKNQVPYEDQLQSVQSAVEKFQKDNDGILPIKTEEKSTSIYEKYPIEFNKLIQNRYMAEPPGNAYENGGIFQYVIINAETKPTVKLFDLRIAEKIRDIRIRITAQGYPPFGKQVAYNVYTINFKKLGFKSEPYVVSPYTNNNLPFVINGSGDIFVDYRMDLYQALKTTHSTYKQGEDIRPILTNDSSFVPAYSLPYTINKKNEPVFLTK